MTAVKSTHAVTTRPTVYLLQGVAHRYTSPVLTDCGIEVTSPDGHMHGVFVPVADLWQWNARPCRHEKCREQT